MKKIKQRKLQPITAERFIRERDSLTKLFNLGILTADEHKRKYDALVERVKA